MESKKGLTVFLLFLSVIFQPSAVHSVELPDHIILGTIYNLFYENFDTDQAFYDKVDADLKMMRETCINNVMVFPITEWNTDTRQLSFEKGDYIADAIQKSGMDLSLLLFKQQQGRHYFPVWKFDEFPELKQKHWGKGPRNARFDVDIRHPGVLSVLEDYFEQVIGRYKDYPNMSVYNVWNEPHYYSEDDANVESFRVWLKEKYGSLENLNRVWADDYTSWEQVHPLFDDYWDSAMPDIDWDLYKDQVTVDILENLKSVVRKLDPKHPVSANPVGGLFMQREKPGAWVNDNWALAKANDMHSISYYPNIWERNQNNEKMPFYQHNFIYNNLRCASGDKPYVLTELQTNGQNGLAVVGFYNYDDLLKVTWSAFANDCKGIFYWKWMPFFRGEQSFGRGLVKANGQLAPRGKAVQHIGRTLKKYGKELYDAHPVAADAAILIDKVSLLRTYTQGFSKEPTFIAHESYEGTFKALFEENIIPDIIRSDLGVTLDDLKVYKIIYLPMQLVVQRSVAEVLKEYVHQGGVLIADAQTAMIDEHDFAYRINPGCGLNEVFGVIRDDIMGFDGTHQITVTAEAFNDVQIGQPFQGVFYKEVWEVDDGAKVIAAFDDGSPAMTEHQYGKGFAFLSAVPLGASYFKIDNNPVNEIIAGLAKRFQCGPDVFAEGKGADGLHLYLHENENQFYLYAINPAMEEFEGSIHIEAIHKTRIKEMITDAFLSFEDNGGIAINIPANRVRILKIY